MEQDLGTAERSTRNDRITHIEEERNEMKDFVYKHLKVVTDQSNGSPQCKPEECCNEETSALANKNQKVMKKSLCKNTQGAVFSGKILSFSCSVCKDEFTYSPNDLLKHFRESHKESLPSYPCDLCGFVTNEFPDLQRHRIGHRNTLVTCEICNNDVQYSLLLLTRHYIMCHSLNGHFHCEKCEFTTLDAGTFVQHIHHHNESRFKCSKCHHVSLNKDEFHRHMAVHTSKFSFNCQICGYGAERSDNITKHMVNVHGEEMADRKNVWRSQEEDATANSSASLKLLLKSPSIGAESKDSRWLSKRDLPNNGNLLKSERISEETLWFDKTVVKKNKNYQITEQQPASETTPPIQLMMPEYENSSDTTGYNNPNGLTVLMVKNKISIPPNCTTKVIGFKVVDGKKHLVLKVMPSHKMELHAPNVSQMEDFGSVASDASHHDGKDFVGNMKRSNGDGLSSPPLAASQSISSCDFQDDIVAVKVKVEEEEIPLGSFTPAFQRDECKEQVVTEQNGMSESLTQSGAIYSVANKIDKVKEPVCPTKTNPDSSLILANSNSELTRFSKIIDERSPLSKNDSFYPNKNQGSLLPKEVYDKVIAICGDADRSKSDKATDLLGNDQSSKNNTEKSDSIGEISPKEIISCEVGIKCDLTKAAQNCLKEPSEDVIPLSEMPTSSTSKASEFSLLRASSVMNSPSQEVFSFHNYSKESFNTSLNSSTPFDNLTEIPTDNDSLSGLESSQLSLTFSESPRLSSKGKNGNCSHAEANKPPHREIETISDIDNEIGNSIVYADDQTTEEETPESIVQDFNIIKVEEEPIPVSENQQESRSSSVLLGHEKSLLVAKEHSDAIISHQLIKERVGTCPDSSDAGKATKATLRILQTPEGKQQMLWQTAENKYAIPVQLKGNTSFKLLTKSNSPRINVSYIKPGYEISASPMGQALSQNGREVGGSKPLLRPSETGIASVSTMQPNVGTISNHYLINGTTFKGPVLVSKTGQCTSVDKTLKTQSTCYFVQKSLQVVKPPNNAGLKLASTQVPLSSRSILAMPMNPAEKSTILASGRQAYLVRFVSQAKSGTILSNPEGQTVTQSKQNGESTGSKVVYRIVSPTSGLFTSIVPTSTNQPLFLSPRSQTQCFLLSNKPNETTCTGVKKNSENLYQGERPYLAPRPVRPPSQRKRRRKTLFDERPMPVHKARRLSSKTLGEKETPVFWHPVAKEMERTLRLYPFSSLQQIKCPRRYQPVVVLNHPDADIPEVVSIMKSVNRYRGAVTKVALSHQTVEALSVLNQIGLPGKKPLTKGLLPASGSRMRPVQSSVRERFLLKLKLRKKGKKKYEVAKTLTSNGEQPLFDCWFCGRLFNSQEDWIGHGQRHLMEATRDWNKFF